MFWSAVCSWFHHVLSRTDLLSAWGLHRTIENSLDKTACVNSIVVLAHIRSISSHNRMQCLSKCVFCSFWISCLFKFPDCSCTVLCAVRETAPVERGKKEWYLTGAQQEWKRDVLNVYYIWLQQGYTQNTEDAVHAVDFRFIHFGFQTYESKNPASISQSALPACSFSSLRSPT